MVSSVTLPFQIKIYQVCKLCSKFNHNTLINFSLIPGNIIMNFTPSFVSDIIKTGFVLSVACSFPLAIFPCRVSLYSLIYKRVRLEILLIYYLAI